MDSALAFSYFLSANLPYLTVMERVELLSINSLTERLWLAHHHVHHVHAHQHVNHHPVHDHAHYDLYLIIYEDDVSCACPHIRKLIQHMKHSSTTPLACSRCGNVLARSEDMLNVPGADGIAGAYVNPHG